MSTDQSKVSGVQLGAGDMSELPVVSADVQNFMATLGARLVGWDETRPERFVLWRRDPIAQGDVTSFQFSTPAGLKLDGYFQVTLAECLFDAGVRAGRQALRRELDALLHGDR